VLSAHGVDIDGARHIADNIVRAFEGIAIDGVETPVTLSVGIALFPAHGTDAAPLLRNADAAMYLAKRTNSGHAMFREGLPAGRGASRVSATGGTAPD